VKTRNWIAVIAGLAVCVAAAYGAYKLATYSWNQVVDYRGPYAALDLPAGDIPPLPGTEASGTVKAFPGRTVLVIVDGLREDASRTMPNLNALRAHGFDTVVRTSQPSLSFPNWTTLLSGAPQRISGVTTNWYKESVKVETLIDVALAADRTVAVSVPSDFEMLYRVSRVRNVFLRDWEEGVYMSGEIVDHAISMATTSGASLVIVHLPDVDEAGHAFGGASKQYADMVAKVDTDLGRLITALQAADTRFIVAADHGHIDTGGHGGPEDVVTLVPAVFAGANVRPGTAEGSQDQVAPSVALLSYLPLPRNATGAPFDVAATAPPGPDRVSAQQMAAYSAYTKVVATGLPGEWRSPPADVAEARATFERVTDYRLGVERSDRLPMALGLAAVCLLAIVAVGLLSWRGLVAALSGTVAYYLVYLGLYFVYNGYRWSLSSFNAESLLKAFQYGRMLDAVIAGLLGVFVAADVYLALRSAPKRPKGEYLPGWLALGVATVLVIQATIGLQVAWYLWYWGASVNWYVPDLAMGFKYDFDLVQLTSLGVVALLAPVITYLVGRYHPLRPRKQSPEPTGA
jgi:hypothetical protein